MYRVAVDGRKNITILILKKQNIDVAENKQLNKNLNSAEIISVADHLTTIPDHLFLDDSNERKEPMIKEFKI